MISSDRREKFGIPVRIQMTNNSQIIGLVFVAVGNRVMETLCDGKPFFAVKTKDGVKLVNKQHAIQVELLSIEEIREKSDVFPDFDVKYLQAGKW